MPSDIKHKVITPLFRVGFPRVFKARAVNEGGEEKFSIECLFASDADLKPLKQAAAAAAREKWGDNIPKNLRSPFKDSGEKSDLDGFEEGCVHISPKSKYKPGLVDANMEPIIVDTEFYGGCYARASVNAYAYTHPQGGPGVSFGLLNVQKIDDGEPFSSRSNPEDDFDAIPQPPEDGAAAPPADEDDALFD